ncbi:MAG: DUF721 domain-containing protein [Parvibaculales bacterium]
MPNYRKKIGAKPIGSLFHSILAPIHKRRGFSETHILQHWNEIMGDSLARFSRPVKLSKAHAQGRSLTVMVEAGFATSLQHQTTQILERINFYYGYNAITKIHIIQGPVGAEAVAQKSDRLAEPERGAQEDKNLQQFQSAGLKAAFSRLRHYVEKKNNPRK